MDIIQNVKDEIVKPPDEIGPVRFGHLMFGMDKNDLHVKLWPSQFLSKKKDADFESGNLGRVDYSGENEYDLYIRADTCNQKYRLWFYFSVSNNLPSQTVIFHICNFSKGKSLYRDGMSPCVRSTSRSDWSRKVLEMLFLADLQLHFHQTCDRIPSHQCFYWRNELGNYILSFTFQFDEQERYEFAYCYPYTYSTMQQYIHNLPLELVTHQVIGHTLQKRNLDLLTVGTGDRTVVVMARVHPGETPASFIMEGFLDFVTNQDCALAAFLREKATLKIVPMLNPDGVALGNYRHGQALIEV